MENLQLVLPNISFIINNVFINFRVLKKIVQE